MDGMQKSRVSSPMPMDEEFDQMLEYLANIPTLRMLGITYPGNMLQSKPFLTLGKFLGKANSLKYLYLSHL